MATRSSPSPIVDILTFLVLAGVGGWFFFGRKSAPEAPETSNVF